MSLTELNTLRPGERVKFTCLGTTGAGSVISAFRNGYIKIQWDDEEIGTLDTITRTEEEAKSLERIPEKLTEQQHNAFPKGRW